MAIIGSPVSSLINLNDKVQHIIVFSTLSVLAARAYPHTRLLTIFLGLTLFGGLIEMIQAIPFLSRDSEWLDWAADAVAVAVTLIIISLIRRLCTPIANES